MGKSLTDGANTGEVYASEWDVYNYTGDGSKLTFKGTDLVVEYAVIGGEDIEWETVDGSFTTRDDKDYLIRVGLDTKFAKNESEDLKFTVTIG